MPEQATEQPIPAKAEEALDRLGENCQRLNVLQNLFEGYDEEHFNLSGDFMHGLSLILGDIRGSLEGVYAELSPK
jgi:hypothetical protein